MKMTGRHQIGLRALFDIAFHCRGQQAQVKDISARQGIPIRYLEEVMQELRKAKLVDARRGPRGGYVLARPAEEISVADIFAAFESSEPKTPHPTGADIPGQIWEDLSKEIQQVLARSLLSDFIARAEAAGLKRATAEPQMYFI